MKRPPIRLARLLSASMLLATTLPSAGVNPKYTWSDSDECEPCKNEESGSASGDSGSASENSIDLVLNIGRAGYERPNLFSSFYSTTKEYIGDNRRPQSPGQLQSYFDSAPIVGRFPVTLRLKSSTIDANAFSPSALTYNETMKMEVLKDNGVIRQVLTSDFLVDIQTLGPVGGSPREGYEAKWYSAVGHEEWDKDGGFYPLPGSAVKTLTVSNPTPLTTYDKLEVLMTTDSGSASPRKVFYRYHFTSNTHTLETWTVSATDTPVTKVKEEILDYVSGSPGANDHSQIRTIKVRNLDAAGGYGNFTVISRVLEDYDNVAGMSRMVSKTVLATDTATSGDLQTTYGYYDTTQAPTPNPDLDGRPRWRIHPDGSWVVWDITSGANSIKEITPVGNAALPFTSGVPSPTEAACKVVTNTYVSASKTTLVKVLGKTVSSGSETFLNGSGGERVLEKLRNDGTADHVSYRAENAYGNGSAAGAGRIAWIVREDGTATTYSYAPNGFDGVTVTEITGAASGISRTSAPAMVSGTTTVTAYNWFWEPVSVGEYDGITATGTALRSWTSTAQDVDDFGRPGDRIWSFGGVAGGTETFDYDCCGLRKHVGRDGSVTMTYRDVLKRVWKVENQAAASGPIIATTTDRSGLETTVTRGALFASRTSRTLDGLTTTTVSPSRKSGDEADRLTTRSVTVPATRTTTESYLSGIDEEENDIWTDLSATTRYLDGNTHTVSGPAVTHVTYAYSSHAESGGGLVTTTTVSGIASSTYTDRLGRTLKTVSPATGTTNHAYYVPGDPSGSRGRLKSVTDADGVSITYEYNGEGEQTTTTRVVPVGTNRTATDLTTTITSDVATAPEIHNVNIGTCYRQIQKLGVVTVSTTYRSLDGLKSATTSLQGDTLTLSTRPTATSGGTSTTTRPDGTFTYTTTSLDRKTVTTSHYAKGADLGAAQAPTPIAYTTSTYDDSGRLLTVTDSRTGTTTYSGVADTGYTESGNLLGMQAPGTRLTTYEYDILGRTVKVDAPNTYDPADPNTTNTSRANITRSSYWPSGRVKAVWGDQTYPTVTIYDGQGRISELRTFRKWPHTTDATGPDENTVTISDTVTVDSTSWSYNGTTGLLYQKYYPDGTDTDSARDLAFTYTYTTAGRLRTRVSGRGITTTYGYDKGFLTSVGYVVPIGLPVTPNLTYTYDPLGRIDKVKQANGYQSAYGYTDLRLTAETAGWDLNNDGDIADANEGRALTRTYENMPGGLPGYRPDGYSFIEGSTTYSANWAFDTAGRPSSLTAGSDTFTYGYRYTAAGGLHTGAATGTESAIPFTLDGPQVDVTLAYDATRNVLRSRENTYYPSSTATTLSKFTYAVNAIGQREGVQTVGDAFGTTPSNSNRTWQYDPLGQVLSSDSADTANDRAYSYDSIGNRTKAQADATTIPGTPTAGTTTYTPNAANQYSSITVGTGAAMIPAPFNDADGNMTTGPVPGANGLTPGVPAPSSATLEWDAENRLVKAVVNNITVNYAYDHLSRLISRGEGVTPATWTHYRYDGWNRIAEYSGTALSKVYTWGLDLSGSPQGAGGVGGLLCVLDKPTGSRYYPAYDGNGNVSEYYEYTLDSDPNTTGNQTVSEVAAHFEYDPFGNLTVGTAATAAAFPFRFSTKPQDPVTGLLYYGYRFYDPLTGRWPSRDPIEEEGGVNLYGFVGNNGIGHRDFVGLKSDADWGEMCPYGYELHTSPGNDPREGNHLITPMQTKRYSYPWFLFSDDLIDQWYWNFDNFRWERPKSSGAQEFGAPCDQALSLGVAFAISETDSVSVSLKGGNKKFGELTFGYRYSQTESTSTSGGTTIPKVDGYCLVGIPVMLVADLWKTWRRGTVGEIERKPFLDDVYRSDSKREVYIQTNWVVCKRKCK